MASPLLYHTQTPLQNSTTGVNQSISLRNPNERSSDYGALINQNNNPNFQFDNAISNVCISRDTESELEVISSLIKIEGLPRTLRREDITHQLAVKGFMIGKAYTTSSDVSLSNKEGNSAECELTNATIQFRTKAIAICFMKRTNGALFSKENNLSYVNSKPSPSDIEKLSHYRFPSSDGSPIHGLVCCVGMKIGIYPVNEFQYQIRPELISCTVRNESFVMKFETQNFIQKNQKEKEMKKFLNDFDNLIISKL